MLYIAIDHNHKARGLPQGDDMAKKIEQPEYELINASVEHGPNNGILYPLQPHARENYIGNSHRLKMKTGVVLGIPAGVTVIIEGTYEHQVQGLQVAAQRLTGPLPPTEIVLDVHNNANMTLEYDNKTPMATIRAEATPAPVLFKEHVPRGTDEEKDPRGTRQPDAA